MFHQGVGLVGFVRVTVAKIRILSKMMKQRVKGRETEVSLFYLIGMFIISPIFYYVIIVIVTSSLHYK